MRSDPILVERLLAGRASFLDACDADRVAVVSRMLADGETKTAIRNRLVGIGTFTLDKLIAEAGRQQRPVLVHSRLPRSPEGCPTRRMLAARARAA